MNKEKIAAAVFVAIVLALFVNGQLSSPGATPTTTPDESEVETWYAQSRPVRDPLFLGPLSLRGARNLFAEFEDWQVPEPPAIALPPEQPRPRAVPQPIFPGGLAFPAPLRIVERDTP